MIRNSRGACTYDVGRGMGEVVPKKHTKETISVDFYISQRNLEILRMSYVFAPPAPEVLHDLRGHEQLGVRCAQRRRGVRGGAHLPSSLVTDDFELFGGKKLEGQRCCAILKNKSL